MLGEENGLKVSRRLRMLIEDMREEWRVLDSRITVFDDEFSARAKNDEAARRLSTIPGIGVLNATALAAAIGEGQTFARGRDLAAWLGLVPRQITTGGKPRLAGITKRGNCYLRKLLIHGARAVLPTLCKSETPLEDGSLPASRGPCCGVKRRSIPAPRRLHDEIGEAFTKRESRRCLREVEARWPDSRPVFWNPGLKFGALTPRSL